MALVEKAKIGQLALKVGSDLNIATDRLVIWLANAPSNADTAAITVAELASIIAISGSDAAFDAFRAEADPLPQYALDTDVAGAIAAVGATQFEQTFTEASLSVAGVLPVIHNLNTYPSAVTVWTNTGIPLSADRVDFSGSNAIAVTLESFRPLVGTWRISIGA